MAPHLWLRKFNNINQIPCNLISMQAIPTACGGEVGGWGLFCEVKKI